MNTISSTLDMIMSDSEKRVKSVIDRTSGSPKLFDEAVTAAGISTDIAKKDMSEIINDRKEHYKKKLKDSCLDAESIFVGQMLKQMRSTVEKGDLFHGGQTEEIFEDMLYDQYALTLSKTADLGIAKKMYEQLSKAL